MATGSYKQRLQQEFSWRQLQIRGAVGNLRHVCFLLGLSGTEQALKHIGIKLEKQNKRSFELKKLKCNQ